ncbi:MAG: Uncharacterised protein [Owenweeksia sp. TMED14]|nr:MAG: Uncharacterised protein [Owenweeksia sp. TMED14]|tara:strand:- start:1294 stop:1422 length:129 start_codon:yes stop_codon:yes gene_type:complete
MNRYVLPLVAGYVSVATFTNVLIYIVLTALGGGIIAWAFARG